ncbi:MAG TPA: tRNA-dihydrouridine synthase family protein [Oligoflexus sp.]|uniref:tRNA-dihydrouridine synthase family protein n=1 Tax=Oligoflexus sp. TaxID=1971216 RepID=UPI002D2F0D1F|nr:tRNA-dihydrouridine synthase family protein [Oligoflexus sp.]HYX38724.1 tRNA-dihydrouridine synthase family protein [Oligoflexus sp.]
MSGRATFGLAPMEGVSELPFRLWLAQVSAPAFASTPFLRATDTFPAQIPIDFAAELTREWDVPYQLIPQVMTADPDDFVRTARLLLSHAEFVDLNCGCPSPNPVSGGAGSSLLKDPALFVGFAERMADALPAQSFSIKMRTGFDDTAAFDVLTHGLRSVPLKQLTVHGRTRRDRYDGSSRWDLIQKAAEQLPCSVVGSGDILGVDSMPPIHAMAPSVSRFIVGRGALRNPWIFLELRNQKPVAIRRSLVQKALACFALLTDLGMDHQIDRLEPLVQKGLWKTSAGTHSEAWAALYDELCVAHSGKILPLKDLELDRITLGRVKMVWNYLRSSLPAPYFEPLLLRSKSLGELLSGLERLDPADESFLVSHRSEWDWLFTSSRQKPTPAASEPIQLASITT